MLIVIKDVSKPELVESNLIVKKNFKATFSFLEHY